VRWGRYPGGLKLPDYSPLTVTVTRCESVRHIFLPDRARWDPVKYAFGVKNSAMSVTTLGRACRSATMDGMVRFTPLHCVRCLVALVVALLFVAPLMAEESAAVRRRQMIEHLVGQLNADSFQAREEATRKLIEFGEDVIPLLQKQMNRQQPEINWRGVIVLKSLMAVDNRSAVDAAERALDSLAESKSESLSKNAIAALEQQRKFQHPQAVIRIRALGGTVLVSSADDNATSTHVHLTKEWTGKNDGMWHVRKLANLRSLQLDCPSITGEGLKYIWRKNTLTKLDLKNTRIDDRGLAHLASLENLRELTLSGEQITDAGMAHLGKLKNVETLTLNGTRVTDAGLAHLAGMTSLRGLDLENTPVTGRGLASIKALTDLKWLGLDGTRVTDAGMQHVAPFKRLRRIYLRRTAVTDAGAEMIKKSLPRVGVLR